MVQYCFTSTEAIRLVRTDSPKLEEGCRKPVLGVWVQCKLQALVYDILPPATAILDYTTGLEKLSVS